VVGDEVGEVRQHAAMRSVFIAESNDAIRIQ
jgi:hypothetical protein